MSERDTLTPAEISKLLLVVTNPRDRGIIVLGLRHGFRSSEIADLKIEDIDLRNNLIVIRRGKGSEKNFHKLTNQGPYFSRDVLNAILSTHTGSPYVFVSRNGGRLNRSQIFRIFRTYARLAGLPINKQHYHCCKHTAAFQMLKNGASMPEVQKRFGWKSLATVGRYLAVSDETADIAADKAEANLAELLRV